MKTKILAYWSKITLAFLFFSSLSAQSSALFVRLPQVVITSAVMYSYTATFLTSPRPDNKLNTDTRKGFSITFGAPDQASVLIPAFLREENLFSQKKSVREFEVLKRNFRSFLHHLVIRVGDHYWEVTGLSPDGKSKAVMSSARSSVRKSSQLEPLNHPITGKTLLSDREIYLWTRGWLTRYPHYAAFFNSSLNPYGSSSNCQGYAHDLVKTLSNEEDFYETQHRKVIFFASKLGITGVALFILATLF